MNSFKVFGLVAVAAMASMAFAGASSASADVLCTENVAKCPKAKTVTSFESTLSMGGATLASTSGEILDTCTSSTVAANIEKQGEGVNPSGKISRLEWGGCTSTTDTVKSGFLEVDTVEGRNTVTVSGTEVTVSIFGVSCTYGAGASISLGDLTPGTPAVLHFENAFSKTAGGFLCPLSASWKATFTITNHTSVFVVASGE